jgi:hypothetical protein
MKVYEYQTDIGKIYIENNRKREIEIISKILTKLKLIKEEKKV